MIIGRHKKNTSQLTVDNIRKKQKTWLEKTGVGGGGGARGTLSASFQLSEVIPAFLFTRGNELNISTDLQHRNHPQMQQIQQQLQTVQFKYN